MTTIDHPRTGGQTGFDFALSPETVRFGAEVREWAVTVGRPFAREADRQHRFPAGMDAIKESCPVKVNPFAGDLTNPYAPNAGSRAIDGQRVLSLVVTEGLAYGDISLIYLIGGTGIGARVVNLLGTPEQIARWDTPNIRHTAFGLSEPESGSDAASLQTTATRDGDSWVIKGRKTFTTFGAVADYVIVFATIDPTQGRRGIRALVVPGDAPGLTVIKANEAKMGLRASMTSELSFENVVVPADHLLGTPESQPHSFSTALRTLNTTRPTVASQAIGIAQAALDTSRDLVQRNAEMFSPRRAERAEALFESMAHALERGRLLARRAAWLMDNGLSYDTESSIAKAYGCQVAERVCLRALQLMGSEGYSEQHLVEKWHRDIKITDIYEGTGNMHRLVVTRALMGAQGRR